MVRVIIIIGTVTMFIPLLLWFLRSIAVVHRDWNPPNWYNKLIRWSFLLMPIGLVIIFLSIFVA